MDVTRKLTVGRLKPMASAGARAYTAPAEPQVWGQGAKPPEAD